MSETNGPTFINIDNETIIRVNNVEVIDVSNNERKIVEKIEIIDGQELSDDGSKNGEINASFSESEASITQYHGLFVNKMWPYVPASNWFILRNKKIPLFVDLHEGKSYVSSIGSFESCKALKDRMPLFVELFLNTVDSDLTDVTKKPKKRKSIFDDDDNSDSD